MTQTTTLIAIARNEGPFLLEWIAYHRAIGFDHIVILSGPSEDGTEALLDTLAGTRAITHLPQGAQTKDARIRDASAGFHTQAYAAGLALPQVQDADWVMTLDIDCYLNIHVGNGTLTDLFAACAKQGPTDVITLAGRVFGNAGQVDFVNRLLLPRFTRTGPATATPDVGVRSLVRTTAVARLTRDQPVLHPDPTSAAAQRVWRNGSGQTIAPLQRRGDPALQGRTLAQINHYPIRSNAVFALHHLQTPPLTGRQQPLSLADHSRLNTNHVADSAITRWAQATTAEIKRLQSFPGVQAAHKDTVARFLGLIETLRSTPLQDANTKALWDRDKAKALMARQVAGIADAPQGPESAAAMQMVDPQDLTPAWLSDLRRTDHKRGWYYADDTFAVQMTTRSSDVLVLSFDDATATQDTALARTTSGYVTYRDAGWSHMGVMAFDRHWYRDPRLFNFLEGQVTSGLFKRFTRVVLTGTGMGGYAATAFASLVPGCTVLAFAPQSTLAPDLVPWETRFPDGQKLDWSGRYRDATTHSKDARAVYIVYDPYVAADRLHAARYRGAHIIPLKSWYAHAALHPSDLQDPLMRAVVADTLTPARFYKMYRARRDMPWYYTGLMDHVLGKGRPKQARDLARILRARGQTDAAQEIENRL